jgi:hypothetical protein
VHSILTYWLNVNQTTTVNVPLGLPTMHTITAFQTVNAPGFSIQDEDESGKCFTDKPGPPNQIIVIHKIIQVSAVQVHIV